MQVEELPQGGAVRAYNCNHNKLIRYGFLTCRNISTYFWNNNRQFFEDMFWEMLGGLAHTNYVCDIYGLKRPKWAMKHRR
jgi:hypothetical protein